MPFDPTGEFKSLVNFSAQPSLNPATLDAFRTDLERTITDLARVARGGGIMPAMPATLTRADVVAIVVELLAKLPKQPPASVDLTPVETRLAALEQQPRPAPSSSDPAPSVDLSPILARLEAIENGIISTRLLVYRSIVADRRLREALAALEDGGDLTATVQVPGVPEAGSKYPVLAAENSGATSDQIREYAWRVFAGQLGWARSGATLPTTTPEELETAITTYSQGAA